MSWSTIDFFSINGLGYAWTTYYAPGVGLFVAGYANGGGSAGNNRQWLVRRSLDGGTTWATVDAYLLDSTQVATARGIGSDAHGNIYVVGSALKSYQGTGYSHWIVRKGSNGGTSWKTVDDYHASSLNADMAMGFGTDSHGNLYAIGQLQLYSGLQWVVRKNPGGVGVWQTVETVPNASGSRLAADNAGDLFAAGWVYDASQVAHWVVRKMTP